MRYTDLIFDLYGTLVDIHTDQSQPIVWEKTAHYFGYYGAHYEPEELRHAFLRLIAQAEAFAGQTYECFPELPIEGIFEALFREKGVKDRVSRRAFHAAQLFRLVSLEYIRLYPGVKQALAALRASGYRLWLLSNAQRVFTAYELEELGIAGSFDGIFLSSDFGCRKPDQRFFEALLETRGLKREDCLMIGNDLTCDIGGAQRAGLDTFYLHTGLSPDSDCLKESRIRPDYTMEEEDWSRIGSYLLQLCKGEEDRNVPSFDCGR